MGGAQSLKRDVHWGNSKTGSSKGLQLGDFLRTAQTVTAMRQVCPHRRPSAFRVTTKNRVIDRLVCLIDEAQV